MNITVKTFDFRGEEFDQDQYEQMQFEVQTEMTAMHQKNDLQVKNVQRKIFEVQGLKKGTYILSAIVK